jgi:hypothetical protein
MVVYWWELLLGWLIVMAGGTYLCWRWLRNSPLPPRSKKPDLMIGSDHWR